MNVHQRTLTDSGTQPKWVKRSIRVLPAESSPNWLTNYLLLLHKFIIFFFLITHSQPHWKIVKFGSRNFLLRPKHKKSKTSTLGGIYFDFWPTRKFKNGGYNFTLFKTHLNQCHILCVCCLINNLVQHLPSYKSKGTYPCQICPRFLSRSISFYAPIPVNTNATSPHEYVCLGARNCPHNLLLQTFSANDFFFTLIDT